jgi:hypothetical protein
MTKTVKEREQQKAKEEIKELALVERIESLEAEVRVLVALCRSLSQRLVVDSPRFVRQN